MFADDYRGAVVTFRGEFRTRGTAGTDTAERGAASRAGLFLRVVSGRDVRQPRTERAAINDNNIVTIPGDRDWTSRPVTARIPDRPSTMPVTSPKCYPVAGLNLSHGAARASSATARRESRNLATGFPGPRQACRQLFTPRTTRRDRSPGDRSAAGRRCRRTTAGIAAGSIRGRFSAG